MWYVIHVFVPGMPDGECERMSVISFHVVIIEYGICRRRSTVVEHGTAIWVDAGSNPDQTEVSSVVVRGYHRLSSSLQNNVNKAILNNKKYGIVWE